MKTARILLLACIIILFYTTICLADIMTQTSYRWRNDDGDVYSAKWKDSVNTPVIQTDNNNIRLRIELITDDTVSANISLGYKEDHYNNPWTLLNRSYTGSFTISPSNYLLDKMAYSDNRLMPFTDSNYSYRQTITLDSSESYYMNLTSGRLINEFEYSIKPLKNIKPGSAYFFSLLKNEQEIACDEYAVLMIPPVSWFHQSFGTKYTYPSFTISNISFADANTGTAVGRTYLNHPLILRTTDGGKTWIEQNCPVEGFGGLSAVCFTCADVGTAVGDGGTILRTTNGGKDWVSRMSGLAYTFNSVSFINADTGIVIGHNGNQNTLILRTLNGGKNWEQFLTLNVRLNSVHLVDAKNGYMVGASGTILKTTNGGQNWITKFSGTTVDLFEASFADVNNGYAVGGGIIIKTTNAGDTWVLSFDNNSIHLSSLFFIDKNTGWAVGDEGMIIKTTDGGLNWSILPSCTLHPLYDVQFLDEKTGWAIDSHNKIIKTTNGGVATNINENKNKYIPENYFLSQNYPNPFNPVTTIQYSLTKPGLVSLEIYDLLGRLVNTIVNKWQTEGDYKISWSAVGLPSGIYFYQIRSGEYIETKKMLLIR